MFKGLNDADASGSRFSKLDEGSYELQITMIETEKTRKTGQTLFVEYEVLKSNNPKDPVGSKRKWSQRLDADNALSNIKSFLYAVMGFDAKAPEDEEGRKSIDKRAEEIMEAAVAKNSLKGEKLGVDTQHARTKATTEKPDGFPYVQHTFRPAAAA